MKKILMALIPLLLFGGLFIVLYSGLGKDTTKIPSNLIDKPSPDFNLPTLFTGEMVSKSDLLGRPYLLNVWGSWCPNCRIEHPLVSQIAESGLIDVYGLNYQDERKNAIRWLNQFGNSYKKILVDDTSTSIDFGIYGAPETFFIDAEGIIRHKIVGEITPQNLQQEIMPLIEKYTVTVGAP
ncbi:DsbE family thiol:disulfide interchange protein [Marinicella sp. W31]|uniref:DsbE family thiol:disulfide interchange protein n=1 Tax=Marinicella sp. W31 TaxID=3023713 RepID=UPI003756A80E